MLHFFFIYESCIKIHNSLSIIKLELLRLDEEGCEYVGIKWLIITLYG
jgi:hypothetical protein